MSDTIPKHVAKAAEHAEPGPHKYKRGRFIPVGRRDLESLLARHVEPDAVCAMRFRQVCRLLEAIVHREYHTIADRLKANYAVLDPDTDVHSLHRGDSAELNRRSEAIFSDAKLLLEKANFRALPRGEVDAAVSAVSPWGLNLRVNLDVFERLEVWSRGEKIDHRVRRSWKSWFRLQHFRVPLYQRLMIDPNFREFPWNRTHLWIVDERRVPFDDDRSNYKMISEIIGDHSGIPPEQVHPMFATADDADVRYEATLREVLGWREKGHDRLDFVLLGMGSDAHTASLFPRSPALMDSLDAIRNHRPGESPPLVRINAGPAVTPPDRVTMMLPLINASRFIGVLVTGKSKQAPLKRIVDGAKMGGPERLAIAEELPILGVKPLGGELRWYLDYEASPA